MRLTSRDSETLAMLLPEELALCFVMLKLAFPAAWLMGDDCGMLDWIGRRWFVEVYRQ